MSPGRRTPPRCRPPARRGRRERREALHLMPSCVGGARRETSKPRRRLELHVRGMRGMRGPLPAGRWRDSSIPQRRSPSLLSKLYPTRVHPHPYCSCSCPLCPRDHGHLIVRSSARRPGGSHPVQTMETDNLPGKAIPRTFATSGAAHSGQGTVARYLPPGSCVPAMLTSSRSSIRSRRLDDSGKTDSTLIYWS